MINFTSNYFGNISKSNKKIQKAMIMCIKKNILHGKEIMEKFDRYSTVLQQNVTRKTFKAIPQYVLMEWIEPFKLNYLINLKQQL